MARVCPCLTDRSLRAARRRHTLFSNPTPRQEDHPGSLFLHNHKQHHSALGTSTTYTTAKSSRAGEAWCREKPDVFTQLSAPEGTRLKSGHHSLPAGGKHSQSKKALSSHLQNEDPPWMRNDTASRVALVVEKLPANAGDIRTTDSIPALGSSPGERNGKPLQCSCLENPVDGGAWWATVHGAVTEAT